jgi:hypothetical protein
MKPILAVLVLTLAASLDVVAQDVRSKVAPSSGTSFTNIIDPDKSIYGAQWDTSEDEFISRFGNPTGYIRLNVAETAMLYESPSRGRSPSAQRTAKPKSHF